VNERELTEAEMAEKIKALREKVVDLVTSANYFEIKKEDLDRILEEESSAGFSAGVDLNEFDFHLIFYRGEVNDTKLARSWKWLWLRRRPKAHDAYRRLFLGLKLKPKQARIDDFVRQGMSRGRAKRKVERIRKHPMLEGVSEHTLHLRIFRLIHKSEMRILFPNAVLRFTLFDRLWLWIGSGGSVAYALVIAAIKIFTTIVIGLYFLAITVAGAAGAVVRGILSVFNTRTRYMARLARSLYFHIIASNQSVLTYLSDDAEEEDIKEGVLAYAFLLKHGFSDLEQVRSEVSKFLEAEFEQDKFAVKVAFDLEDGFVHLKKLGLLQELPSGERKLLALEEAHDYLTQSWAKAAA
jgi:hypothetical protein